MKDLGIPNKIVIAGTSAIKLNDRFSNLPPPKRLPSHRGGRGSFNSVPPKMRFQSKNYSNNYEIIEQTPMEFEEVVMPRRRFRPPVRTRVVPIRNMEVPIRNMTVPIENRLSVPVTNFRERGTGKPRGGQRGAPFGRGRGAAFSSRPQISNQVKTVFKKRGVNTAPGRGVKVSRGRKPQNENFGSKKSVEQLDRELDDYMRKKRHTPIVI